MNSCIFCAPSTVSAFVAGGLASMKSNHRDSQRAYSPAISQSSPNTKVNSHGPKANIVPKGMIPMMRSVEVDRATSLVMVSLLL
ncbi:hypothetical protein D3C80_1998810 [compost metagenome]